MSHSEEVQHGAAEVLHAGASISTFAKVWIALLAMTGIEVLLAYEQVPTLIMLTCLLGLSIIKAALIIAYFMHLKYEVSPMKWMTMSSLVICLCLMLIFLPDAYRILRLGVPQ